MLFVCKGSAQSPRAWRKPGPLPCCRYDARPWGLDTEPGRLNESQTGSGLRKKKLYHGLLENVLKEGNEGYRRGVY